MNNSYQVSKKDLSSFEVSTAGQSSILSVSDLNDNLIHYGIVGDVDTSVSIPAHSLSVKTKNGDKLSRAFDDKLKKAGLEEGDAFIASFQIKEDIHANVDKITKRR